MVSTNPSPALHDSSAVPMAPGARQSSDILVLLFLGVLPLGLLLDAGIIGQLYATELLFLLMLPFLWLTVGPALPRSKRAILWWTLVWFVVLFATDIYRGSFIGDYLRGWAKIAFFAIDVYVLVKLLSTEKRLLVWLLGWNIAYAISIWGQFDDFSVRWKFGVGVCVVNTAATTALLLWPRRCSAIARIGGVLCIVVAAASLFLNARNTFLCLSFSGMLLVMTSVPRVRNVLMTMWDRHGWLLFIGALGAAYLAGAVYVEGASHGWFGDDARVKLEGQQNDAFGPVLGTLAGGRSEFNASFAAIGDSPIVGYGSSAHSAYYYNIYVEHIREHGTPDQIKDVESKIYVGEPPIPTHSHIFGAWVEAGIVGAAFWLIALRQVLGATRRSMELASPASVLILLNGALFIWNILFSPFGGDMRLFNASLVALFFCNTGPSSTGIGNGADAGGRARRTDQEHIDCPWR